ncbi:ferritin-like domain-containing protein [Sphingomonas baiyangensis]|uniref:Ferritin-like domain-containing protein n=1 Tax=Sphingomonas baiyangensis TaxID=2572576 RepID=A0A4U1L3B2_9SPHN|nr:ferritin-like domain-containing protein [Sphingomonas baiyangensis]TKD51369.1 ferritin-like domain-containing protein [Sphingomonas baiyangensis]
MTIGASIGGAARAVLLAGDPVAKRKAARAAARAWRRGALAHRFDVAMPDRPARPDFPELLPPNRMPKRGKGGSERGRIALIHSLAHIEFVAIDLAFDLVGRFGARFPRAFVDDWVAVGADEAMHFALVDRRLRSLGSFYGALPAHDGLWDAALATAGDVHGRLAVVPMVLEARGLDVTPATIERFAHAGDAPTVAILRRILTDEVRHVRAGTIWFNHACARDGFQPAAHWQAMVARYFRGAIKPPFNDSARESAGLTREYYGALAAG